MLRTILINLSAAVLLFLILAPLLALPFERKDEMTHDDIINKEIEEEHEFMRARIKELENKPTYPFNEAFNKQLQEENAFLKNTINHFAEIFGIEKPNYTTNKDFADFIGKVENKLQAKEQECEALKGENFTFVELIKTQEELIDKYEQALDEIQKTLNNDRVMMSFYQQAYNELINLIKKFDCYEGWMEQND